MPRLVLDTGNNIATTKRPRLVLDTQPTVKGLQDELLAAPKRTTPLTERQKMYVPINEPTSLKVAKNISAVLGETDETTNPIGALAAPNSENLKRAKEVLTTPTRLEGDAQDNPNWFNIIRSAAGVTALADMGVSGVNALKSVGQYYAPEIAGAKYKVQKATGFKPVTTPAVQTDAQLKTAVNEGKLSLAKALRQSPDLFKTELEKRGIKLTPKEMTQLSQEVTASPVVAPVVAKPIAPAITPKPIPTATQMPVLGQKIAKVSIPPTEIKRVAGNILRNNPEVSRTDAEAMAKDVIGNRKQSPLSANNRGAIGKGDFQDRVIAAQDLAKTAKEQNYRIPVNSDGSITIYHGTSAESAQKINTTGKIESQSFFSPNQKGAEFYGKTKNKAGQILPIKVDARSVEYSTGTGEIYAPNGLVKGNDGIWKSPSPLAAEARKYKSAEEFVNSQKLYHGTSNKAASDIVKNGFKLSKEHGGYANTVEEYISLTDDIKTAQQFADVSGLNVDKIKGGKVLAIDKSKLKIANINKTYKTGEGFGDYINRMKKEGWDVIDATSDKISGYIGEGEREYILLNRKPTLFSDKTKSQLTDIYNQATGKGIKKGILSNEKGAAVIPGEEKEFAGNILLNKYPEEVRVKLRELYKQHPEAFETPTVPMEFIKKMAEENPQKYFSEIFKAPEGVLAAEAYRIRSEFAKTIMQADMDINEVFAKAAESRRAGAEIGRGLKQMTEVTNEQIAALQKLDEQIAAAKDPDIKAKLVVIREIVSGGKKQLDRTLWNQLYEVWVNGILSSPDTHIVNTVSNVAFALAKPMEKFSYALTDLPFRALTGKKEFYFSEVPAEVIGGVVGLKEGVKNFFGAFTDTVDISKMEERLPMISGLKGKIIRVPTRFLQAEDEFFKGVAGSMERYSQATKIAKKQGLKGKAMYEKIAELINEPTPEIMKAIQAEKLYRTFQDPLGKYTSSLMGLRNRIPGIRYIAPFLRTPVNLAKRSLERIPLGVVKIGLKMNQDEPYTQSEKVKDISHFLVGSALSVVVAMAVMEGKLTGRGPKEKGKRDAMYMKGWQPYSVLINGKYYPYGRTDPLGTTIGFTADIVEKAILEKKDINPTEASDAVALLANQLINKTYLSGVSGLMNAVLDPKRYGEQWANRAVGGVVPYSGALRYTAKAMDTTVRQPEGIKQSLMSNLPVLSKKVPPKMNVFGEVAERPSDIWSRLTPFEPTKQKDDLVANELLRLDKAISYPSKKIGQMELSQNEYNRFLRVSGQETKNILYKIMNSPGYSKLPDEQKIKLIENATSLVKQLNWTRLKVNKLRPLKTGKERIQQYRLMQR